MIKIKTDAVVAVDDLGNVWYKSDVDVVLGKITESNKFLPAPNRDISPSLLRVIADMIENK
jgi:hypothetical protein